MSSVPVFFFTPRLRRSSKIRQNSRVTFNGFKLKISRAVFCSVEPQLMFVWFSIFCGYSHTAWCYSQSSAAEWDEAGDNFCSLLNYQLVKHAGFCGSGVLWSSWLNLECAHSLKMCLNWLSWCCVWVTRWTSTFSETFEMKLHFGC